MNANTDSGSTYRVNSNSWFRVGAVVRLGFLAVVGVVLSAASLAAQPFAYVTNQNSNNVSVIDTATDTVVTAVPVGTQPFGVAVTPTGTFVYVTNSGGGNVSVIDTATNTEVDTDGNLGNGITKITVGSGPRGIAVTPNGGFVYVANFNSTSVSVINTATNTVTATITVGTQPFGVAVTPDGAFVYVTNRGSGNVSVIATATNTEVDANPDPAGTRIPVGINPRGIAVTPDGELVYVTNTGSNNVSVIDTATNLVTATIAVGSQPLGVAVTPDGAFVYVASTGSDTVSVIDTSTNTEVDVVTGPGTRILVGTDPQGIAVTPDGALVYVANITSDNVSVIDTATNTVIGTVAVGDGPTAFGQFIGPADTTAPNTTITSAPPTFSNSVSPSFSFESDEAGTFECSLDGAAFASCTSPQAYGTLADGAHTFQVRATDTSGNPDPSPATHNWTIDTAAPDTSITSGPSGGITVSSATFDWTGSDNITPLANLVYAYRLDPIEATFSAFGSATTKSYTNLSNGSYTFYVKAKDQAGNEDQTPATRSFSIAIGDITVTPTSLNFGSMTVGGRSADKIVTVKNDGTASITIGAITLGGVNANQFDKAADNCSLKTLLPTASCTVAARFKPTSGGAKIATLIIPSNDPDENPVNVSLSGIGGSGTGSPDVTVTPSSINFGSVAVKKIVEQIVTVQNDGTADLTITAITLGGPNANQFNTGSDKCSKKTLAPNASCTVAVRFKPTATGPKTASLTIPSNDPDENPVNVSLSGTGTP